VAVQIITKACFIFEISCTKLLYPSVWPFNPYEKSWKIDRCIL